MIKHPLLFAFIATLLTSISANAQCFEQDKYREWHPVASRVAITGTNDYVRLEVRVALGREWANMTLVPSGCLVYQLKNNHGRDLIIDFDVAYISASGRATRALREARLTTYEISFGDFVKSTKLGAEAGVEITVIKARYADQPDKDEEAAKASPQPKEAWMHTPDQDITIGSGKIFSEFGDPGDKWKISADISSLDVANITIRHSETGDWYADIPCKNKTKCVTVRYSDGTEATSNNPAFGIGFAKEQLAREAAERLKVLLK